MDKKLTPTSIAKEVSRRTGITQKDAYEVIMTTFVVIKDCLYNNIGVSIPRFGRFFLMKLKSGVVQLPTGERVYKNERYTPKFTFYQRFKRQIVKVKTMDQLDPSYYEGLFEEE